MILIAGATGLLGGEICRLLAGGAQRVRALIRPTSDQAKVEELRSLGAETVRGDFKDRRSLDAACRGVSTVVSTVSATLSRQEGDTIKTVDHEGHLRFIDAAKSAGAERFVFISFLDMDVQFPLQTAKRDVEQHVRESGLAYTILQPTFFMEVWLSPALGFDAAHAQAQIYGSGENKISWISYQDVAKFAAACLNDPGAREAVIRLGGPEALSPLEVVRIFEEASARPFDIRHVSEEQLWAQKEAATDPLQESFAGLMLSYARGSVIDMRETLSKYPLPLTTVRDYASRAVRSG